MPLYEVHPAGCRPVLVCGSNMADAIQTWIDDNGWSGCKLSESGNGWMLTNGVHFNVNTPSILYSAKAEAVKADLISLIDGEEDSLAGIINSALSLL